MLKKVLLSTAAAVILFPAIDAKSETKFNDFSDLSSWMVRARVIDVDPDVSSNITSGLQADAKNDVAPELDFTYFLTNEFAAELILATTKHEISASGIDLGEVWALPPTLTFQYHPELDSPFKPYIGAGVNYTFFYDEDDSVGIINDVEYEDGFGYDFQVGFDYMLDENWGLNFDVKKLYLETDVNVNNGAFTGNVDLDPWIFGTGITYKF